MFQKKRLSVIPSLPRTEFLLTLLDKCQQLYAAGNPCQKHFNCNRH
ncbi:hypothetical protein RUMCAL_03163 [Ruminococcus callidus ATCC 27760]|uniref:Uncharacterized protein n=1 Tax=Ruminococcus callidus ATCC 27760 TaxID=411473 RepID=U2K7A0_9FIRM|nr:hypothetical protein RUMCAL_03163 [Ruminococcus callidus ATCC 27760]